jgi:hypothetical protein
MSGILLIDQTPEEVYQNKLYREWYFKVKKGQFTGEFTTYCESKSRELNPHFINNFTSLTTPKNPLYVDATQNQKKTEDHFEKEKEELLRKLHEYQTNNEKYEKLFKEFNENTRLLNMLLTQNKTRNTRNVHWADEPKKDEPKKEIKCNTSDGIIKSITPLIILSVFIVCTHNIVSFCLDKLTISFS